MPGCEYDDFLAALRRPLPITFRVVGTDEFAQRLVASLEGGHFSKMRAASKQLQDAGDGGDDSIGGGGYARGAGCLAWYPGSRAWSLDVSRQDLRRSNVHSEFKKLLVPLSECGVIARQEAVSMIPPLLLDVGPGKSVSAAVLSILISPQSFSRGSGPHQVLKCFPLLPKRIWMVWFDLE